MWPLRLQMRARPATRKLVKGMVGMLTKGLTGQFTATTAAHYTSDRKIVRLAEDMRAMCERMRAQETKAQAREERMMEKLEMLRATVVERRFSRSRAAGRMGAGDMELDRLSSQGGCACRGGAGGDPTVRAAADEGGHVGRRGPLEVKVHRGRGPHRCHGAAVPPLPAGGPLGGIIGPHRLAAKDLIRATRKPSQSKAGAWRFALGLCFAAGGSQV